MKKSLFFFAVITLSMLLSACGSKPPQPVTATTAAAGTVEATLPAVTPSATPDLCTQAQLPETVKIVNTYMKQFGNYSSLSVQVPGAYLPQLITTMKSIRQALQQQPVPPCLTDLKHYALQYMDTVVLTVVSFQANPNLESLNAGIEQARSYNDQYALELARLLGVTLAPENVTPVAANTPAPAGATVMNPGPNPLNLHVAPSLTSESIAMLDATQSANAIGKSSNGEWIQIEVPGKPGTRAWVYASLVQYTTGDPGTLPVATP